MQLVNGAGTQSYRKCIDPKCDALPESVLRGRHRKGYAIQILFCRDHESVANTIAERDFKGVTFSPYRAPPWLRKAQEDELQSLKEQERPVLRNKEG